MQQSQWRLEEGLGVIKRTTRSRADTAASTAAGGDGGAGGGAGAGASWGLSLAEGARPETAAAAKVFEALSSSTKSLSRAFRAARAAKADLKAARSPSAASSQFVHYLQVQNLLLPVLLCVDDWIGVASRASLTVVVFFMLFDCWAQELKKLTFERLSQTHEDRKFRVQRIAGLEAQKNAEEEQRKAKEAELWVQRKQQVSVVVQGLGV